MQVEAVYVIPELIPDSPAEPWNAHDPNAPQASPVILPLRPKDPQEAADHDEALWGAGVRLSCFFQDNIQPPAQQQQQQQQLPPQLQQLQQQQHMPAAPSYQQGAAGLALHYSVYAFACAGRGLTLCACHL